jgi:hypothetical protein
MNARNPSALQRILGRLPSAEQLGTDYKALCPAHQDHSPSLSTKEGEDGRVLLHCFAGCDPKDVVAALGLKMKDLFPAKQTGKKGDLREGVSNPPDMPETLKPSQGLTLAQYSEAKKLPLDFLKAQGLTDMYDRDGVPAVRIPYYDEAGTEGPVRIRRALTGPARFRWRKGSKLRLYGLDGLPAANKAGRVVVVEGESDRQTLEFHGIPALGLPGAGTWKEEWADAFDGIPRIEIVVEPDQGGVAVIKWLAASKLRDRAYLVTLDHAKDVSDFYLAKGDDFKLAIGVALQDATPWHEWAAAQTQAVQQSAWVKCAQLALTTSVLDQLVVDLPVHGLVGEVRAAKLLYLVVSSRLLKRPVSCVMTGLSSAGKSHVIHVVLRFFPPAACYVLTAMSERALAYSDESLVHRTLVLYEAAGLSGDFQSYLIRSLLSEGRVNYETVEKIAGRLVARRITREGPTGLLMTTTMIKLHHEIETRFLSVPVSDTAAQTKAVLQELARQHTEPSAPSPDALAPWHAFQTWLTGAERQVTIPYARVLAELIPAVAVRLRRDFGALLALIETHAILHQATREKNEHGRIIATITDYAVVRELVLDVLSEGVEAGVTADIAEAVHAVKRLVPKEAAGVKIATVQRELGLDKVSAWRRVKKALKRGFLRNLEDRKYHSAILVLADPLPEDTDLLPSPEALEMGVLRLQATGMGSAPPPPPPPGSSEPNLSPPRSRGRKTSGRSQPPTGGSGGHQG